MNKLITASIFILLPFFLAGQGQKKNADPLDSVSDKIFSYPPNSIKIEGYLGEKMVIMLLSYQVFRFSDIVMVFEYLPEQFAGIDQN